MKVLFLGMLLSTSAFAAQPSCKADPSKPGQFILSCGNQAVGPVGDEKTCQMMGQMLCPQMPGASVSGK